MDYFYTVTRFTGRSQKIRHFSPEQIRFLLLNAPSEISIAVTVVRALNWIAINPTSTETEEGLADFFTMIYQEWINQLCYTNDANGFVVDIRFEVETTMVMPTLPEDSALLPVNQYNYFCGIWDQPYLQAQFDYNRQLIVTLFPQMAEPAAEARLLFEIRRQMAHANGWIRRDIFHLFENPPSFSEAYPPMYPSPAWYMPYIHNPELRLPGTIRLRTPVGELPVIAQAVAVDLALESDAIENGLPVSGDAATETYQAGNA